ncbi:TonB-dependent receptor [Algibacter mikhailovii]|uniref:TonB-dependent receptor n=1 Tax=Algibacter mikhailovii TaxID=425498 RepID=A0A918R5G9_9FLAO|nr:carboxypeptidase-like regulatory domain-containing protein [Algibacter mikhailovii]GGZ85610.1 TonB-dependent receptor [Algibacter mikhailovii]
MFNSNHRYLFKLRSRYAFLLFVLFAQWAIAQNKTNKITLEVNEVSRLEVIELIETKTNYVFYFVESWLGEEQVSLQLNNASIEDALEKLFENTLINYFLLDDSKVILTQNNLIRDTLPPLFQDSLGVNQPPLTESPIILYEDNSAELEDYSIQTVRIGKERPNANKDTYKLEGIVLNAKSNKPLPDIVIVASNGANAITDNEGKYSLELPVGVNFIETKSLGIQDSKRRVVIYDDGALNFVLNESVEQLDELVIQANVDRNVKQAVIGVSQIKIEEIKNMPLILGERDILKVATTLPGITTAGEGSSGYNVRGGKTDQNLILLDDGVIYNPSHFFGIFSAINPFTSGEANIYKGSIPAQYGGRLSSVIDIKTKKPNPEKFGGEVSIGPVTGNVTLDIPIIKEKSSLLIGGRGTYSDWILKSLDDKRLNKSKASFYDVIAKYDHEINNENSLRATAYYSKDNFSITSDSLYSYSNFLASVAWSRRINSKNYLDVILANSNYNFNIAFEQGLDRDFDLGYQVNETELKLKMRYLHSNKHKFNYGISTKLYNINPGSIDPLGSNSLVDPLVIPKEKALESALFLADDFEVNEKLLFSLGLRYSFYALLGSSVQRIYEDGLPLNEGTLIGTKAYGNNEVVDTYGGLEFRLSGRYFLADDLSFKMGYNSTYQYIHTLSNNTTVSPTDTWKLSDSNIKPQQAQQISAGLFKNIDGNRYELSIEGYFKKTDNILDYKVGANLLLNETIETEVLQGEGKAYGVEFLLKKNHGRLNGWLGYSYSRSLNKLDSAFAEEKINNGTFFPSNFDKPHDLSLVANYKLTQRFSLSTNFVYQTGRPITYPVGSYVVNGAERVFYSDRNKFRIPDYYRLDLGLNIEGNHKIKKFAHSFWNISIYNVLGRNNPYSVFFVTENNEIKAYQSSIFSLPVPTITYNFKF